MSAGAAGSEPEFEHPTEREVWRALQEQLPAGAFLFSNLCLTSRKGDCEADIVVGLAGAGVAVLEVKGGTVRFDNGSFLQVQRLGEKVINPARQARTAMYALRDYLDGDPRWHGRRTRFAYLAVFPTARLGPDVRQPHCLREQIADCDQIGELADVVRRLLLAQESPNPAASQADVDILREVVAGRPKGQRDLLHMVEARENEVDLLTARQRVVLDVTRRMTRVAFEGGAGSGKTFLAVEQARRLARAGQRVGLLCYSRGLTAYLTRRVAAMPEEDRPAYVGTFHRLGVHWGAPRGTDDDSDYWERRLPEQMLGLAPYLPDGERFDAFVVDEAQDFAEPWWPALLAGLRDPEHGGLYVFTDRHQRVFPREGDAPIELCDIPLDENLRNTKRIAQTFGSLTPWQMTYRGGEGPPVRFVQCTSGEAVDRADDEVVRLMDEGWPAQSVALLTTGSRHPVQIERVDSGGPDAYWESYWAGDDAFYGHVLGFKGLERPAVVLAVNGFGRTSGGQERAKEKLYVGLSRARDLLVVCGDLEVIRAAAGDAVAQRLQAAAI